MGLTIRAGHRLFALPGAERINNFGVALRGEKFPFLVDLNERFRPSNSGTDLFFRLSGKIDLSPYYPTLLSVHLVRNAREKPFKEFHVVWVQIPMMIKEIADWLPGFATIEHIVTKL